MKLEVAKVRHTSMYPRVFINYGPGLVPKADCGWRKINGIAWRFRNRVYWFHLRGKGSLG